MNILYRILLTFNATSLIISIFFVKEQAVIQWGGRLSFLPDYVSYIIYFLIPIFTTFLSILIANFLAKDKLVDRDGKKPIIEIEQANNAFLPSYLGYFFVALSVPYCETLIFVYLLLFVFTFFSQTLYFNPLFLMFGYKFYYVTTRNNVKQFLITRKNLKSPDDVILDNLRRINNFTFIDKGGK